MRPEPLTGKTTRLMEEAVSLLAELPEGCRVYITGPHTKWLTDLSHMFKKAGLNDVLFLTSHQIVNGALRGARGLLLIDDFHDIEYWQQGIILEEQIRMKRTIGR